MLQHDARNQKITHAHKHQAYSPEITTEEERSTQSIRLKADQINARWSAACPLLGGMMFSFRACFFCVMPPSAGCQRNTLLPLSRSLSPSLSLSLSHLLHTGSLKLNSTSAQQQRIIATHTQSPRRYQAPESTYSQVHQRVGHVPSPLSHEAGVRRVAVRIPPVRLCPGPVIRCAWCMFQNEFVHRSAYTQNPLRINQGRRTPGRHSCFIPSSLD